MDQSQILSKEELENKDLYDEGHYIAVEEAPYRMPNNQDIQQMAFEMEPGYFDDDHGSNSVFGLCSSYSLKRNDRFYKSSFFFDKYTRYRSLRGRAVSFDNSLPRQIDIPPSPISIRSFRSVQETDQYEADLKSIISAAHDPYLDFVAYYFPNVYDYAPLTAEDMKDGYVPKWMYNIYSLPNLALPMSYFCVGVALQLVRTPLIIYFIQDMNASPSDINVLFTVMAVPWCFKVFYGFLSDCLPIGGQRRKPYFFVGWLVYVVSNIILAIVPKPSIQICTCFMFTQTAGFMLADVMTDALIVERSQYEPIHLKGTMQSQGYVVRFFGSVIGATIGALVFNEDLKWFLSINIVFLLNALIPIIFLVPVVPFLMEIETSCVPKNFFNQLHSLFETVQLKAVWRPMFFVYIYNALQWTNPSWMNYLVEGLDFKAWMIGIISIGGSIMTWIGIIVYEKYFFATSWRIVFFWCTILAAIISLGQILLVFRVNSKWGINDIYFSAGDDVLVEFVIALQFLPMCIMYLGLCPEGSEGTTYALLTTFSNLAGTIAYDISTALTNVWDVSTESIQAGNYDGVWKLSLLCGIISPLPLVFLFLIPESKHDQLKLQLDTKRHFWKGIIFMSVTIISLVFTFTESYYEVYYNDESDRYENHRRLARMKIGH